MEALLAVLPLSLSSGINLYLTVLALGIADRAEVVTLPPGLDIAGSVPVLAVAGLMTLVEFFADKIPYVDSAWDAAHTFIRPLGAVVIALNLIPAEQGELTAAFALLAGTTALTAHSGKASLRALVNTSPEPVSNSVVSVAEDASVIGLLALAATFPFIAAVVGGVVLVGIIIGLVFVFRWASQAFGSVWAFLRGQGRVGRDPRREQVPRRRV